MFAGTPVKQRPVTRCITPVTPASRWIIGCDTQRITSARQWLFTRALTLLSVIGTHFPPLRCDR